MCSQPSKPFRSCCAFTQHQQHLLSVWVNGAVRKRLLKISPRMFFKVCSGKFFEKPKEFFAFQSSMLIFAPQVFPTRWFLWFLPQRRWRSNTARATDYNSIGNDTDNDKIEIKVLAALKNKSQIIKVVYSLLKDRFLFRLDFIWIKT